MTKIFPNLAFNAALKDIIDKGELISQDEDGQNIPFVVRVVSKNHIGELGYRDFPLGPLLAKGAPKQQALFELGKFCAVNEILPTAIFTIAESWYVTSKDARKGENLENIAPSQHPNRKEALVIAGLTPDNRSNFAMVPLTRDKDNRISFGKPDIQLYKKSSNERTKATLLYEFWSGFLTEMSITKGERADGIGGTTGGRKKFSEYVPS